MNKLSAYTIASNCTDSIDIKDGIDEINEAIQMCIKQNRTVPSYYYVRLEKLETKLKKKAGNHQYAKNIGNSSNNN